MSAVDQALKRVKEEPLITKVKRPRDPFYFDLPFNPKKLKTISKLAVVEGLGNIATGQFSCGGMLQAPQKVRLHYLQKSGQWSEAVFPGLQDADFQQLLESADVASFGKGKESVIDQSIRDAFVLEPEKFLTSFQLCNTSILKEIQMLLVPDAVNVRAELYKVNIYSAPTGCFKAHVDTPRGGDMFGTLVVCFPSHFQGGALITRHNGQEVVYDWSSSPDDPMQGVQWAAFYSDVEHEILTVTEGHRVTLTYNLYGCDVSCVELDVTSSPFYANLKAAVQHPYFLRKGGILGFKSQHSYAFDKDNKLPDRSLPLLMKGSDRTVVLSATSLGLKVQVKPEYTSTCYEDIDFDESQNGKCYLDSCFKYDREWLRFDGGYGLNLSDYRNESMEGVTWCQNITWQPALVAPHYGNEPLVDVLYQATVILITIPPWAQRQGECSNCDEAVSPPSNSDESDDYMLTNY